MSRLADLLVSFCEEEASTFSFFFQFSDSIVGPFSGEIRKKKKCIFGFGCKREVGEDLSKRQCAELANQLTKTQLSNN